MKVSLILGINGQDGSLLAKEILESGGSVWGGFRRGSETGSSLQTWRLDELGIRDDVNLLPFDLNDYISIQKIIEESKPNQIINLAGNSYVADSFYHPHSTLETNFIGTLNLLESIKSTKKDIKVFLANSSEIFDSRNNKPKNEKSILSPLNPYGLSQLSSLHLSRIYRNTYGMNIYTGIFFNHESQYRSRSFVARKISYNLARLKLFGGDPFRIGNLDSKRDWGNAEDFVKGIKLVLEKSAPDEFVFSTGKLIKLREILKVAAIYSGFEPKFEGSDFEEKCFDVKSGKILAVVDSTYFRKVDTPGMIGDSSYLKKKSGWKGSRDGKETIKKMVKKDIERMKFKNSS